MSEQNSLTLLIWFFFLKNLLNPSEDRKQKRKETIIIMPAHHSVKVTAESIGCILEASLPLLISILFQRGLVMKPLRRSPKASLCRTDPHQEGRENGKVKKGRESISTERGLCFGHHVKCLNTSSHLILPKTPFCR